MVYAGFNQELMGFLSDLASKLPPCPAKTKILLKRDEVELCNDSSDGQKCRLPLEKFWAACKPLASTLREGDPAKMRSIADKVSFIAELDILPIWDKGMTDQHRYVISAHIARLVWLAERASLASAFNPKLIVAIEEAAMDEKNGGDPMRMVQSLMKRGVINEALKDMAGGLPAEMQDIDFAALMNNTQPPAMPVQIKQEKK